MNRVQKLIQDYEGMNDYARELLSDLAKSFRERFPAPTPRQRKPKNRSSINELQRG